MTISWSRRQRDSARREHPRRAAPHASQLRIKARQIGYDVSRKGISDGQIINLLPQLRRPTFFTRDQDFYERHLCHARYGLVWMAVHRNEAARFVRRFLKHPDFNTRAKRMGTVVRVSSLGLQWWSLRVRRETVSAWPD